MNVIKYPAKEEWGQFIERPHLDTTQLSQTVASVLADVRQRGDEAVKGYELKFDHVDLETLAVSEEEIREAEKKVSWQLRQAIELAHHNINVFHESQRFVGQKV